MSYVQSMPYPLPQSKKEAQTMIKVLAPANINPNRRTMAEFHNYQQIPQYKLLNHGMSLGEFKSIFLWEYIHRLWGRLLGMVLVLIFGILPRFAALDVRRTRTAALKR